LLEKDATLFAKSEKSEKRKVNRPHRGIVEMTKNPPGLLAGNRGRFVDHNLRG
jgi:hypothetical protein